jgi:hypothetical protein
MSEENPTENSNRPEAREVQRPGVFDQEEITRLKQEILERQRQIAEKLAAKEKELAKESFRPEAKEGVVTTERIEVGSAPTPKISSAQIQKQSQQIGALDPQNQVRSLCNLAFRKGLDFAIQTARNLNNPYVLDAFHDALIDELYRRLIEERKIGEV